MGQHFTPASNAVIEAIVRLGRALHYETEREAPIGPSRGRQAVDVAWYASSMRAAPLFAFEVESRARREASANVLKVFAKPSSVASKPLFLFHVIIDGGGNSPFVDDLRHQFGTHNYKLVLVESEGFAPLVRDVLAQHRRLATGLDIEGLVSTLADSPIGEARIALQAAQELGFEANYLRGHGRLAIEEHELTTLVGYLKTWQHWEGWPKWETVSDSLDYWDTLNGYASWAGFHPLVRFLGGDLTLDELKQGLENQLADPEKIIDFDDSDDGSSAALLHNLGPYVYAVYAALIADTTLVDLAAENVKLIAELFLTEWHDMTLVAATWLLHIAAAHNLTNHYMWAQKIIAEKGGIFEGDLYLTGQTFGPYEDVAWIYAYDQIENPRDGLEDRHTSLVALESRSTPIDLTSFAEGMRRKLASISWAGDQTSAAIFVVEQLLEGWPDEQTVLRLLYHKTAK